MAVRMRWATAADAAAVAGLHLASYRAAYQGLLPAEVLFSMRADDRASRWRASLKDPQRQTLIAEDEDVSPALIGFAEVGPSRDDDARAGTGELMTLHVAQPRWRHGLGRVLHGRAVAALAARGFQTATVWVLTGNTRARAFYEAMDWNHEGTAREQVVSGTRVAEVRYWRLCPGPTPSHVAESPGHRPRR